MTLQLNHPQLFDGNTYKIVGVQTIAIYKHKNKNQ